MMAFMPIVGSDPVPVEEDEKDDDERDDDEDEDDERDDDDNRRMIDRKNALLRFDNALARRDGREIPRMGDLKKDDDDKDDDDKKGDKDKDKDDDDKKGDKDKDKDGDKDDERDDDDKKDKRRIRHHRIVGRFTRLLFIRLLIRIRCVVGSAI